MRTLVTTLISPRTNARAVLSRKPLKYDVDCLENKRFVAVALIR